jgi:hypothetical protein
MVFSFLLSSTLVYAAGDDLLLPKYKKWLDTFPAKEPVVQTCVSPKPNLNKITKKYRTAISYYFKESGATANLCSKYFVMSTPITGGGDLFIFDCETGKPNIYSTRKYALTKPYVSLKSCAFIINPPDEKYTVADFATKNSSGEYPLPALGPPRLYIWEGHKVKPIKDEIWPGQSASGQF